MLSDEEIDNRIKLIESEIADHKAYFMARSNECLNAGHPIFNDEEEYEYFSRTIALARELSNLKKMK